MRILHIAQSVSGGIASYFEEVAAFQARHYGAASVRFLIPAGNGHHLPSIPETQLAEFSPCDRNARGLLALGLATHRETRNFAPTIVHIHSTFAGAVSRPAILLSGRKPRIVYCPHGWVFAMEVPQWKRRLFSLIEKCLVPLTDAIVNISHTDHKLALSSGIRADKMVTIRNGIAAHFPPCHGTRIDFQQNRINLIFVGRHDRQKGIDYLIDVFSEANVPGLHLHVVGAPVVESAVGVAAENTPSNITFYGWQPRDEVSRMIASADALIMPSRWEGFGLVALEAMRLGKPVLASRRGALPEIIEDGRTGLLFDMERRSELRDILRGVKKDKLVAMGIAARNEFQRAFTSDRLNAELANLYRSLANGSNRKSLRWTLRKNVLPRI